MTQPLKFAICAPKYKRPLFLQHPLMTIATRQPGGFESCVLVADNDPELSAKPTVTARNDGGCKISLIQQEIYGIATAPNTLVAAAMEKGATFIAVVDDDPIVELGWTHQLLGAAQETNAVIGRFSIEKQTVKLERIFDQVPRTSHATGESFA